MNDAERFREAAASMRRSLARMRRAMRWLWIMLAVAAGLASSGLLLLLAAGLASSGLLLLLAAGLGFGGLLLMRVLRG